jgi:ketosteroid isomerase-like protein
MYLRPEDKVLILEANARYNHAFDTKDVVEWLDTWTDYATLVTPDEKTEGKQPMRAWFENHVSDYTNVRHFTFNIVSNGDTETAVSTCDFMVLVFDDDPQIIASGSYLDHLTRIGDAWKFASRKLAYDRAPLKMKALAR